MRTLGQEQGLTLLEVLIASAVMAIAILALAGMFPSAYQNVKYGGEITRATALAQEMMEILRNESFGNLASYDGRSTGACGSGTDSVSTNCRKWRDDITAVGLPSGSGTIAVVQETSDLRRITVTVNWTERTGRKEAQLVTYVAQQ
ncbi:MAG: prepilin-type N-terminal cleavage/methylation domain-containing protein [candidate division NC10 bacterium]|nr:prepilin-type N-terminal cleavage/methylation domain-containing protein [candidate division NC10 bacterium]